MASERLIENPLPWLNRLPQQTGGDGGPGGNQPWGSKRISGEDSDGSGLGRKESAPEQSSLHRHEFTHRPVSTNYVLDIVPGTGEGMVSRIIMGVRESLSQSCKRRTGHYSTPLTFSHITNMY